MSEKPFKNAEEAIHWIEESCKPCSEWEDCDIIKELVFAYVRLNGDVTYSTAQRIGYKKGKKPVCTERIDIWSID